MTLILWNLKFLLIVYSFSTSPVRQPACCANKSANGPANQSVNQFSDCQLISLSVTQSVSRSIVQEAFKQVSL